MPDTHQIWQRVCVALKPLISEAMFHTWVEPLTPVAFNGNQVTLVADSQFARDQVLQKCRAQLAEACAEVLGKPVSLCLVVDDTAPLNNLNFKLARSTGNSSDQASSAPEDPGSSLKNSNLNNLKVSPEKKWGGVPRLQLFQDETLKKAIAWGVEEWLIQVSIREYGEYVVKGQINRIHQIPEAYFKPQYGPIPTQRGRLFNKEMQKLKASRRVS